MSASWWMIQHTCRHRSGQCHFQSSVLLTEGQHEFGLAQARVVFLILQLGHALQSVGWGVLPAKEVTTWTSLSGGLSKSSELMEFREHFASICIWSGESFCWTAALDVDMHFTDIWVDSVPDWDTWMRRCYHGCWPSKLPWRCGLQQVEPGLLTQGWDSVA